MTLSERVRVKIAHRCLVGECLFDLLRARRAVRRRPFAETAKTLSQPLPEVLQPVEQEQIGRQVRWAMGAVRRRVPWNPTCLMRAIAAQRVLARRRVPSQLVLSVTPASGDVVDAHAWLEAGGMVVTGRTEQAKYVPIYIFSNAICANGTLGPEATVSALTKEKLSAATERAQSCSL